MLLEELGILSEGQDLTVGAADSTNVIDLSAIDYVGMTDVWLAIETEIIATGDGSDTYEFSLVVSQETTLDTNLEVLGLKITDFADVRISEAGRPIMAVNISKQLIGLADEDYRYLGLIMTISSGATLSVNAAMSPSAPSTPFNIQVVRSNVGVPT